MCGIAGMAMGLRAARINDHKTNAGRGVVPDPATRRSRPPAGMSGVGVPSSRPLSARRGERSGGGLAVRLRCHTVSSAGAYGDLVSAGVAATFTDI